MRGDVAGCIVHSDRGSQFRSRKFLRALTRHRLVGSMGRVASCGDNAAMESFFALLQKNVLDRRSWTTREQLRIAIVTWIERTYPPTPTGRPRPFDPGRIRGHHEHASRTGCVTTTCHLLVQQPRRLNGRRYLVPDNHDRMSLAFDHGKHAERLTPLYEDAGWTVLPEHVSITLGGQTVLLSHYPYFGDSHDHDRTSICGQWTRDWRCCTATSTTCAARTAGSSTSAWTSTTSRPSPRRP